MRQRAQPTSNGVVPVIVLSLHLRPAPISLVTLCYRHAAPGAGVIDPRPYGAGKLWLSDESGAPFCDLCACGSLAHGQAKLARPEHAHELLARGLDHFDAQLVRALLAASDAAGTEELASLAVAVRAAVEHPEREDSKALRDLLALLLPTPAPAPEPQTASAAPDSHASSRARSSRRASARQ